MEGRKKKKKKRSIGTFTAFHCLKGDYIEDKAILLHSSHRHTAEVTQSQAAAWKNTRGSKEAIFHNENG